MHAGLRVWRVEKTPALGSSGARSLLGGTFWKRGDVRAAVAKGSKLGLFPGVAAGGEEWGWDQALADDVSV